MEKSIFSFLSVATGLIFCLLIFVSNVEKEENEPDYNLPQLVKSVSLNKTFTFAGETIPMNADTKERMDRELLVNSYWQSATLLNIKLAHKFFPTIERILKEEGVPEDFKYLAVAESGLRNVRSHAGAKGYWQFMKAAAKDFGLEVNSEVDERYHLEKSTRAAAKYIKQLKKRFGTWLNAAAAYNMGPTNLSKQMSAQKEDNYFDLNLGEETSRYVFRLVAFKEILQSPESFGFYIEQDQEYDSYGNTYNELVETTIPNMGDFAHERGITYRMLKYHNPWLIDNKLTVKKNKYMIKIPRK